MPYNKLNISGAQADVLSWVSHGLTLDEENMNENNGPPRSIARFIDMKFHPLGSGNC